MKYLCLYDENMYRPHNVNRNFTLPMEHANNKNNNYSNNNKPSCKWKVSSGS